MSLCISYLQIKSKLQVQQSKIKAVEDRKKLQIEKKFAKKVQAARVKHKQQEKRKNLQHIEQWKQSKFKKRL